MLSDAQVERWSRQIVLPEVGGRGQERLCAARATVCGGNAAAALAAELLERAGVRVVGDAGDVVLDLGDQPIEAPRGAVVVRGRMRGARMAVVTLVGRPCGACLDAEALLPRPTRAEAMPAALGAAAARVLGAIAAGEALSALLRRPRAGRMQTVDLGAGAFAGTTLPSGPGCARCAGSE